MIVEGARSGGYATRMKTSPDGKEKEILAEELTWIV